MQKDDDALLSISLASHGQLAKMLITLDPRVFLPLNIAYLYIVKRKRDLVALPLLSYGCLVTVNVL